MSPKVRRYIEVYSNETDELLYSYKITIPDNLVIEIVSPDEDDEFALYYGLERIILRLLLPILMSV